MDAATFRAIRRAAGLSIRDFAATLRVNDVRGIIRYEKGEQAVSGPVSVIAELIARGDFPSDMIRYAPADNRETPFDD